MPCRSDHMKPNIREIESQRVAQHLLYILPFLDLQIPLGVREACAAYSQGRPNDLDEWTALLCSACKEIEANEELADECLYDGRNAEARKLADWWERHKEFDRKREAEKNKEDLKLKALSVLAQALSQADFGVSDATYDGDNKSGSLIFKLDGMEIQIKSQHVKVSEWEDRSY